VILKVIVISILSRLEEIKGTMGLCEIVPSFDLMLRFFSGEAREATTKTEMAIVKM